MKRRDFLKSIGAVIAIAAAPSLKGKEIPTLIADIKRYDPDLVKKTIKSGGYKTIYIFKDLSDTTNSPVFVGINGVGYTVPRGINVNVPNAVIEVLENAKVYEPYSRLPREDSRFELMGPRSKNRLIDYDFFNVVSGVTYPFRIMG